MEEEERDMRLTGLASIILAAILSVPAWGTVTSPNTAVPGTLNYVEGKTLIGAEALNSKSIGSAELQPGQMLTTQSGKAEILLTPGVFLRLGDNSTVKMISPSLTDTEIGINQGHAMVEVAEIHPENDIRIDANGTTTQLLKTGLYDFNLKQNELRVFDGKALVQNSVDKRATVKSGHELALVSDEPLKTTKFDKKTYEEDDLYRWSSLRSAYLAEANVNAAGTYVADGWGPWGPGWWGAGWYWDPWFSAYTFIPGDGIFYSPFGWGFYSPWWVYRAPLFGYGYYRYPYYRHFSADAHTWGPGSHYIEGRTYANGVYRGPGSTGSGFHSGARMMAGGGFGGGRGGSEGGFRGGGSAGGGFHGGGFR
jgi:hypothetical protein